MATGVVVRDFGADGIARLLTPVPPISPVPLRELRLQGNRIGHVGAGLLAQSLRDNVLLETLMLSGNPLGDEGIIALANSLHARKFTNKNTHN